MTLVNGGKGNTVSSIIPSNWGANKRLAGIILRPPNMARQMRAGLGDLKHVHDNHCKRSGIDPNHHRTFQKRCRVNIAKKIVHLTEEN